MADKVYETNKTSVKMNGLDIRLASAVVVSTSFNLQVASGIGDGDPVEHVPGLANYRVTLNGILPKASQLVSSGLIPENMTEALKNLKFAIEIFDKESGALLEKILEAKCDDKALNINQHTMIMDNATFLGTGSTGTWQ